MTSEQKNMFHNLIAEFLGLDKNKVINAYQNAGQIKDTYAVLRYYSYREEAPTDLIITPVNKNDILAAHNLLTCEVQLFTKVNSNLDACYMLTNLVNKLDTQFAIDTLRKANIAVVRYDAIQDISALLDTTQYQTRASVDITIRFTPTYIDNIDYIADVDIKGKIKHDYE